MSGSFKCPRCGAELLPGTSFCTHCMHTLVEKNEIPAYPKSLWNCLRIPIIILSIMLIGVFAYFLVRGNYGIDKNKVTEPNQQNTGNIRACEHNFAKATCALPETCTICGETRGLPTQTHEWTKEIRTVHHPEVGHWDEVETDRIKRLHYLCYYCGYEQDGYEEPDDLREHMTTHSNQADYQYVLSNLETNSEVREVWVPVYESKWVVDKEAYDETVTVYTCTHCGETK